MYVINKSANGQYYFVLKASNGEVILTSEMYTQKQNCYNGIESVKVHSPYDGNYTRRIATNGQYYFNLKASNNQIIGTSEMYVSIQGRDNGIESVKRFGSISRIVDSTGVAAA